MIRNIRLIFLFSIRNLKEEKLFSLISIFGVALAVGLFLSILNSTQNAITSMSNDIKKLNPISNYEIHDKFGNLFDESIIKILNYKRIKSYPIIKINAQSENNKLILPIYGIDSLKAIKNSNIYIRNSEIDLQKFFQNIDAALVTDDIATRLKVKKDDELILVANGEKKFLIAGVISSDQVPSGVYLDIGNFQEKFNIYGKVSRIDIILSEKQVNEIKSILPNSLILQNKSVIIKNQGEILKSFKMNLYFISFIAFLVGFFMLFNTIFITVVKKREQIGTLRSLGSSKFQVLSIFIVQSFILGILGSILGLLLGQILSIYSTYLVEDTISTIFRPVYIKGIFVFNEYTIYSVMLGILIALLSSIIPSIEATKVKPVETVRRGTFELKFKRYYLFWFFTGLFFVLAGVVISYIDYHYNFYIYPYLSYLGVFLILIGFCSASFLYLEKLILLVEKTLKNIFKAVGFISFADIFSSSYRFAIALISVAISTALIVSMVTLIDSFKISLYKWISDNLRADIFIKSASCSSNFCFEPLDEDILSKIKLLGEVEAISTFRAMPGNFRGKEILLGFGDEKVVKKYHNGIADYNVKKSVAVSEFFKIKYGIKEGDFIEIDTPKGLEKFEVREIFNSYSTINGFIIFDNSFQKEYWGEFKFTQISIYLKKGVDVDKVIYDLDNLINNNNSLDIFNNKTIRARVMNIFNKSFAITYAIQGIALIVSLLGMGNMLYAVAIERRKEISILKYLGANKRVLSKIYTLSAGVIGLFGALYGVLLGSILSVIIIKVVNTKSFGWRVDYDINFLKISLLLFMLVIFVIFAGMLPIKTIKQLDPKKFATYE